MHLPVPALAILAGVLLFADEGHAASFDCSKATGRTEQTICGDAGLSALDSQLAEALRSALALSNKPDVVSSEQAAWLASRESAANAGAMGALYRRRIAALWAVNDPPAGCPGQAPAQIDACALAYAERAEHEVTRYVAAARRPLEDAFRKDPKRDASRAALELFDEAHSAWRFYSDAECGSLNSWWMEGPRKNAVTIDCRIRTAKARSMALWENWLRPISGDAAPLPRPAAPTQ